VASQGLSATLEDYLEGISRLVARDGVARVRDIAAEMSVHKSTVTSALKGLAEKGLVNYSPYEVITFTSKGKKAAEEVVRRHEIIRRFLSDVLSVDEGVAEANACRMEHVVDREVLDRLAMFGEFARTCPRAGKDWLEHFRYYYEHGGELQEDETVVEEWLKDFRKTVQERESEGEGGAHRD